MEELKIIIAQNEEKLKEINIKIENEANTANKLELINYKEKLLNKKIEINRNNTKNNKYQQ
jgi:hypothetical protein